MRTAWIGLGGNLGDARANLLEAIRRIAATDGVEVVASSSLYETAPWGKTDQPWYLNVVLEIETVLDPEALLQRLLSIESEMGRVRAERWGPRVIDLDYLLDSCAVSDTATLRLPHPEMENRAFVLAPLSELRPSLALPSGRQVGERLAELAPSQPLRRLGPLPTIPA